MQTEHTPEPWGLEEEPNSTWVFGRVTPCTRTSIADVYEYADARRIVACVNECEGITTEGIESGIVRELIRLFVNRHWDNEQFSKFINVGKDEVQYVE